jgi:beta-lactamase class A
MINYSDNVATSLLDEKLNGTYYRNKVFTDLHIPVSKNDSGILIDIRHYASLFRVLFNASYLNKVMSDKALELLTNVEFKKGLVAGVPENIRVAHKFGEREEIKIQTE